MEKKHDYLTKEIAYPIIARYLKTGGLASTFYKKEGLSESQFYTWRKRYIAEHGHNPKTDYIHKREDPPAVFHPIRMPEVKPSTSSKAQAVPMNIELEYPNGVIIRLDSIPDDARLATLIKLY